MPLPAIVFAVLLASVGSACLSAPAFAEDGAPPKTEDQKSPAAIDVDSLLKRTEGFLESTRQNPAREVRRPPRIKKAIIYVAVNLTDAEQNSIIDTRLKEEEYYKSLGYQVEVVRTKDFHKAVLDDLWNGISAMSFFGHGGKKYTSYLVTKEPTIGVNTGPEWQQDVGNDFANRYQSELSLSPEEAGRRAKEDSRNFGLDIVRNYSCFGASDNSIAKAFVKPGGSYFGADRYRAGDGPVTRLATELTPAFISDYVSMISAFNLTEYRVSETGEMDRVDPRLPDHYDNPDRPSEGQTADMERAHASKLQECEKFNPQGKGLEKGQFYSALDRYQECRIGGSPLEQCVRCVNKLISGSCYVREATMAGWGLCLSCTPDGGVAPENRFIEKNRCPVCAGLNYSLSDFKPAPDNCVPNCSKASDPRRRDAPRK